MGDRKVRPTTLEEVVRHSGPIGRGRRRGGRWVLEVRGYNIAPRQGIAVSWNQSLAVEELELNDAGELVSSSERFISGKRRRG